MKLIFFFSPLLNHVQLHITLSSFIENISVFSVTKKIYLMRALGMAMNDLPTYMI